jgi:hypothetical protein
VIATTAAETISSAFFAECAQQIRIVASSLQAVVCDAFFEGPPRAVAEYGCVCWLFPCFLLILFSFGLILIVGFTRVVKHV